MPVGKMRQNKNEYIYDEIQFCFQSLEISTEKFDGIQYENL